MLQFIEPGEYPSIANEFGSSPDEVEHDGDLGGRSRALRARRILDPACFEQLKVEGLYLWIYSGRLIGRAIYAIASNGHGAPSFGAIWDRGLVNRKSGVW
jgi:hypothetical protein